MGCCNGKEKPTMSELAEKHNLTEKQLTVFKQTFDQFDKNKDGKIVASELCEVMQSLGYKKVTVSMAVDMISVIDKDKSRAIEFDEFVSLLVNYPIFDKNKDGYITGEDIKNTMKSLDMHLTDKQINDMMLEADTDKDGKITKSEFKLVYEKLMNMK